jgi:hypothetical protein
VLALSGGFTWLAVVSTLARMIVYAVTIAAWLKTAAAGVGERLLGFAGLLLSLVIAAMAGLTAWITLAALALAGTLLFYLARRSA